MLLVAALLACAAVMIAIERRGLLDLDQVAREALGWSGLALALGGSAILIRLWSAERFRVTIGRLMVFVAMLAILIAFILHMLRVEQQRRGMRLPPGTSPAGDRGQGLAPRPGPTSHLALVEPSAKEESRGQTSETLGLTGS